MRKVILAALVLALSGCATTHVPIDKAKPVPADRLLLAQDPLAIGGTLQVTRDAGYMGGGCFIGFYLDGKLAATFDPGEAATFSVPEGQHIVGIGNHGGKGLCAVDTGYRRETSTLVRPGEVKKFRISVRPGDGPVLEPTSL